MPETTVVQHRPIRLRHIKVGATGTTVLGKVFSASWAGINGRGGFSDGEYERRVYEEGTFAILFPNSYGEDGVLHRERFEVISSGRRTPGVTEGAITYGGGTYRPGDEWIEIYEDSDLVFVGTPTQAEITPTQVKISGYDGMWLLKKCRETALGFWHNAPRDAFEHYTSVWQTHVSDHFDGGVTYTWGTTGVTGSDGKWYYVRCANTGAFAGQPDTIRLLPNAVSQAAQFQGTTPFNAGWTGTDPYASWRMEVSYRRSSLFSAADSLRIGILDYATGTEVAYVSVGSSPGSPIDAGFDTDPPGPFRIALEGHGRFIYMYANGKLLGHMPRLDKTVVPYVRFERGATTYTGVPGGEAWVDVDFVVVRRTRPFLGRGTDKGDHYLVGDLPPEGLVATYYDDHDLQLEVSDANWTDRVLAPTRAPYANRLEPSINGSTHAAGKATWQPPGPASGEYFSCRWKGAIYLDLEHYDYYLRMICDDRARVYLRNTRQGEELIESWPIAGQSPTTYYSGALKTGTAVGTPHNWPAVSGWYPLVVDWSNGGGPGTMKLQIWRDSLWTLVGEGDYPRTVKNDGPASYWRLVESGFVASLDPVEDQIGGIVGTATNFDLITTGNQVVPGYQYPPITAPGFDNIANNYIGFGDVYDFAGTAAMTVEFWVRIDVDSSMTIVGKMEDVAPASADGWDVFSSSTNDLIHFRRMAAGAGSVATSPSALILKKWYHVACVYDGTNMTVYLNGVAGTPVASALSITNHAFPLQIGRDGPVFGIAQFQGSISELAIYSSALTGTQIANHYNAAFTRNNVIEHLSPMGVYEDLVRYESHYDVLKGIADTYAFQYTCEPRQLESGEFPGQVVPRNRVGRDTEKILGGDDALSVQLTINAEEVVDAILADGAGLADQAQGATITAEQINFDEVAEHLVLAEDYIQLSDISFPTLFIQRLESMLALRGSAWEQIAAQPGNSHRELLDAFPMTGALAEFAWMPGDSVRLDLPSVGIIDTEPRQILGVKRTFVPDGYSGITVAFRQRPRNLVQMFRQLQRQLLSPQRNYQGQLVTSAGTLGATGAADPYTRVVLPMNLSQVVRAELVVTVKSDASLWNAEINGTNRFTVGAIGRFDVRSYVGPASGTDKVMKAKLVGGTGTGEYHLELLVVV